jgi:phosphatidylserine decarboxylase
MAVSAARLAADSLRVLPRKHLSRALGRMADVQASPPLVRRAVGAFVRYYDVDMSEVDVPEGGFSSFNEFFTRRLVPGARPVDPDPGAVVSPADGRVDGVGPLGPETSLQVKGQGYRVDQLLGDPDEAARFDGGSFFVCYLSPRDYHRVHAPVGGRVSHVHHVPGTLFPVNSIGTGHIPELFARNERVAIFTDSRTHGRVATVLIGAIGVGRIGLTFDDVRTNVGRSAGVRRYGSYAPSLDKGEELGVFNLGSTVIVFLGPRVQAEFLKQPGQSIRMGEAVVRGVDG